MVGRGLESAGEEKFPKFSPSGGGHDKVVHVELDELNLKVRDKMIGWENSLLDNSVQ